MDRSLARFTKEKILSFFVEHISIKRVSSERRYYNAINDNIFMEFGIIFLVKKP